MGPLHNKQAFLFIHYYCVSGDHLVHAGFPLVESYLSTSESIEKFVNIK